MAAGQRKFAADDPLRQAAGESRNMVFAMNEDQFLKSRKQSGMSERIALNAGEDRFGKGFCNKAKSFAPGFGGLRVFDGCQVQVVHFEADTNG